MFLHYGKVNPINYFLATNSMKVHKYCIIGQLKLIELWNQGILMHKKYYNIFVIHNYNRLPYYTLVTELVLQDIY